MVKLSSTKTPVKVGFPPEPEGTYPTDFDFHKNCISLREGEKGGLVCDKRYGEPIHDPYSPACGYFQSIKNPKLPKEYKHEGRAQGAKKESNLNPILASLYHNEDLSKQAETNFKNPELMFKIHEEISKKHLFDDNVKMTVFIVCCTSYLEPDSRHQSIALKGDRSVGKDNLYKSVLRLFPKEDYIILTHATQATLEDDIQTFKIVAHSEINLQRNDKGAGALLVEAVKQLTEGGMSAMKKDVASGYKTTKHSQQKQKTVIYGTAEVGNDDDELQTRFIVGAVGATPEKIETVNQNSIKEFAGIINERDTEGWFSYGVKNLLKNSSVVIPFATGLPNSYFDNADPRAMRDTKRFLACVAGIAWVHQLQRKTDEKTRVVADLSDFLLASIITSDFFNYTYKGFGDARLQKFMDAVNEHLDSQPTLGNNIFSRRDIQEKMGVTINTVKKLSKGCQDLSIIRFHSKESNEIYFERCQKGVKKVLMGVKWNELLTYFEGVNGVKIPQSTVLMLEKWNNLFKIHEKHSTPQKNDTLKLTPSDQAMASEHHFDRKSLVHLKCSDCGNSPCNMVDGKPFCQDCLDNHSPVEIETVK